VSYLPRGKNADYWEGRRAEAARLEALETARLAGRVARGAARDAAEIARDIRRDAARKNAVIQRHPWHFAALDQQEVGEMSGHEAAAHSLEQDGFALRDGEDALRMREAVDHGIQLGVARARGTRDLNPSDVLGRAFGGPAALKLGGERPSAQDSGETFPDRHYAELNFMDKYTSGKE
jgi:hypothetical protein